MGTEANTYDGQVLLEGCKLFSVNGAVCVCVCVWSVCAIVLMHTCCIFLALNAGDPDFTIAECASAVRAPLAEVNFRSGSECG